MYVLKNTSVVCGYECLKFTIHRKYGYAVGPETVNARVCTSERVRVYTNAHTRRHTQAHAGTRRQTISVHILFRNCNGTACTASFGSGRGKAVLRHVSFSDCIWHIHALWYR